MIEERRKDKFIIKLNKIKINLPTNYNAKLVIQLNISVEVLRKLMDAFRFGIGEKEAVALTPVCNSTINFNMIL